MNTTYVIIAVVLIVIIIAGIIGWLLLSSGGYGSHKVVETGGYKWVFFPYYDSHGGDVKVGGAPMNLSRAHLPSIDAALKKWPNIIAYNTGGWLKTELKPYDKWNKFTDDPNKGLYVRTDVVNKYVPADVLRQ